MRGSAQLRIKESNTSQDVLPSPGGSSGLDVEDGEELNLGLHEEKQEQEEHVATKIPELSNFLSTKKRKPIERNKDPVSFLQV